ncbi:MAG: GNAT family N-acetyltransferase [Pyrinomonadaceae bacterium]|nr:GNAT family N-acetyltransferase [Pyrinomonadaceae bacterium]
MSIEVYKLCESDPLLAKSLFCWFQEDDGVEDLTAASDEYLKKLLSRDDFHTIIAINGDKIVGGLTAYELSGYKNEETEMYLFEMGVYDAFRRQGIATRLIETLKDICRVKGIEEMFVGAWADNVPALKLYEKTGGKGIKVVEFTYKLKEEG